MKNQFLWTVTGAAYGVMIMAAVMYRTKGQPIESLILTIVCGTWLMLFSLVNYFERGK